MPAFFEKVSNLLFQHNATLLDYQKNKIAFDPKNQNHVKLVESCTQSVQRELLRLQAIDLKMTIAFSVAALAYSLSWILPFCPLAFAAMAYGAYQLGQRTHVYAEYNEALENLARCCIWTLGEVSNEQVIQAQAIQDMITVLAPLTNAQQLKDFIDDKYEDGIVEYGEKVKQASTFLDSELDQEQRQLFYKIYGYKQGSFMDILQGIGFAIRGLFQNIKQALSRDNHSTHLAVN
ncbi:hypothetical protein [Legionella jordanis]|uniref:Uncharacterized protein n=1 Tax=Legionella jordanis TaxID=456 RepID=A0A0W0V851_9GAMM|nr:hypothetical protein [Legionella jordanis]KTD16264.1 hypothetical protein Ljor_0570 [Legionella jordanis]RMX04522.1 hypothetical protein EAW55_03550 [Legionella jordanis]VEH12279.1 Uncharacterised protein [Legionella jordanis]HAT8713489.1 hypothetical protein [Legionella jordanis]